jgi:hypothetical protein
VSGELSADSGSDTGAAPGRLRLVALTAPDGVLHVLFAHVHGLRDVAHVALGTERGAPTLATAFDAARCTTDDAFADLVVHVLPLAHTPEVRHVEVVHLNAPSVRPESFTGPLGESYLCVHLDAPAALAGRAWVVASAQVQGGPWCVAVGRADPGAGVAPQVDAETEAARLARARATAGEAARFAPYRLVLADDADDGLEVVDARAWCRAHVGAPTDARAGAHEVAR